MSATSAQLDRSNDTARLYGALEERMIARDQVGASRVFYDLVKAGRPLNEMIAEAVRIHAPYTHVPYHERIDDGYVNFVNNDHCLLSARATVNLARMMPDRLAMLPMAQTVWYIPTGLDIWNQKIGLAPGHYTRGYSGTIENPPPPNVYWPDDAPVRNAGAPLRQRLGDWMTLVHRGQVMDAYRHFLGLMEETEHRREVLAELVFAGLMDVQDRMYLNRSYTTGHKGYRARATVELGDALGWDNAHQVIYAGALDIAVGPRWYSVYEAACNTIKQDIEGETLRAVPYGGVSEAEAAMLRNTAPLSVAEEDALIATLLHGEEPADANAITALLRAGRDPRRIIDALQIAAAQLTIDTHGPNNFSMPMHCYEYTNALGWFYDTFDHPRRLRLLYVGAAFVSMTAHHQKHTGELVARPARMPAGADRLSAGELLARLDAATILQQPEEAQGWLHAYLGTQSDRANLVRLLAVAACKIGNDPHNQEIPQNMLEDFAKSRSPQRDRLLMACVQHCAGHRKYGDLEEAARRFGEGVGVSLQ
jgi:hypothetical protein